jgi:hypothetical protein
LLGDGEPLVGRWFTKLDKVYFWIDTICVPMGQNDTNKKKAVDQMEQIYRSAVQILVVDPLLRTMSFETSLDSDIAARLATSSWWTRCWTFQEGILAQPLIFRLADATLKLLVWIYRMHTLSTSETALPGRPLPSLSNRMRSAERRRPLGTSLELGGKKGVLKVFDRLPDLTKHRKNLWPGRNSLASMTDKLKIFNQRDKWDFSEEGYPNWSRGGFDEMEKRSYFIRI